ncbi:hypothetical protein CU633_04275 [Bacillus sp. V3-13]|uniref:hypothetical protein n=1 Tax=Bacillus sp. V3-13 TaxID=2053728 RepID=UPI000C769756|nr:hypothetical protein [Bacillus sp. V3-13]PLR78627.1 hypothetical protein CU633_04275 [Bacillus sp. V3-13]
MSKNNKIATISLGSSMILLLILLVLDAKGIYVQLGPPSSGVSHHIISILLIIAAVISAVYLLKDRGMKWIAIGIGLFFISLTSVPELLTETEYTTFFSPDRNEKFVVIEKGYVKLYQLSNSGLFMTALTSFDTDRGYKPFSEGAYELEWVSPHTLIIHYAFDYRLETDFKTIEVQYHRD